MKVELILEVVVGDPVPEWLLYVEPRNEKAVKATPVFSQPGAVVLFNDQYWFLASGNREASCVIQVKDGDGCSIGAPDKDFVVPFQFQIVRGASI